MNTENLESLQAKVNALEKKMQAMEKKQEPNSLFILITTNDYDKIMSALLLAVGAASMGMKTTMYFTFWGINALKKKNIYAGKDFMQKAMTMMMPKRLERNSLSKYDMLGMGKIGMKYLMKKKNIATVEELMKTALDMDVKIIACEMTMNLMGITREELNEKLHFAGVSECLDHSFESSVSFFI